MSLVGTLTTLVAPLGLVPSLLGQETARMGSALVEERASVIAFEGVVVDDRGAPAAGALVMSSAGGRAIADRNGSYRLEASVPDGARSVQITAAGDTDGTGVASTSVDLAPGTTIARVDPLVLAPLVLANDGACPIWLSTFGALPGVAGTVHAFAVFDDGSGPALYVGGTIAQAGSVPVSNIARWDGTSWSDVGGGMAGVNVSVRALAVFDDGSGPALYATGRFTTAGGAIASNVAKWDGSTWSTLGTGLVGFGGFALAVFDDGSGPALGVAGNFTSAGGVSANGIARWDGASWSALGSGLGNAVFELTVFDDGSGPALHAGGLFSSAGGAPASNVAKWDGTAWSSLGGGVNGPVDGLAVFDDGTGAALYVGGSFSSAGGAAATNIARWDGASWSPLGPGLSGPGSIVQVLAVFDDGTGPALVAGGLFATSAATVVKNVARWNGQTWSALDVGPSSSVLALAGFDDGRGHALYAGGFIACAGSVAANGIARWAGSSWNALDTGIASTVFTLTVHDDGGGPALYAGGRFVGTGTVKSSNVVKWDGPSWSPVGTGVGTSGDLVRALASFDDGDGPELYAAGFFPGAHGIARWDGASWGPVGAATASNLEALTVFDDGSGPALYVGGNFIYFGSPNTPIARWDGASWSYLGAGVNGNVYSLAVFDDGTGPALFAGGTFTRAGGLPVNNIAKWDGTSWSPLGSGVTGGLFNTTVFAMAVLDDGSGPALYVGGLFATAGGVAADNIARWDGASWAPLGSGVTYPGIIATVRSLAAFDDGSGPALYVGGNFSTAGGVAASSIATWDGSSWAPLGSGVTGYVQALTVFDDRAGTGLCAGGTFFDAGGSGDSFLGKWGCPDTTPPTIRCPTGLVLDDRRANGRGEVVTFEVTAIDPEDPTPSLVCVPPSGSLFPPGTTVVTCTATDFSGNQASCQFTVTVGSAVRDPRPR
jgi:hypothetical protein